MNNLWKAFLQQATESGMTTVLGLLKSGKLIVRCTSDRGDMMKLLGDRHEKFDVPLTRKLFTTEPRNPWWTRKHLVTDRGDLISILKKRHGLNNSSLETMKQNWNCQKNQHQSCILWMIRCEKDRKEFQMLQKMERNILWVGESSWL